MLHQVHHMTNVTDCWVCGLLPSVMHKNDLLVSLTMSYLSSCEAWFQLLSMVYIHYHADVMNMTKSDYEAVLEYIVTHQDYTPGKGGKKSTLHPDACMNIYESKKNATWLQNEMMDFQGFSVTEYFQSFHTRNITEDSAMPVPVINTTASFCIQGFGSVRVGESKCNYTYRLNTTSSPPLLTPHNVYFGFLGDRLHMLRLLPFTSRIHCTIWLPQRS